MHRQKLRLKIFGKMTIPMIENLVLLNELVKVKLPPWKIWKADASSVNPSSERMTKA